MDIVCIECQKVFSSKESSLENGNKTGSVCLDCFIIWLENFIRKVEAKGDPQNKLPFLRKLLTQKLIQRQEKGGAK